MDELERFLDFYEKNKAFIKNFANSFKKTNEDEHLFGELVFCLCTPQSRAKICRNFVESLKSDKILFSASLEDLRERMKGIRFSDRKAEFITQARDKFPELKKKIIESQELREWLLKNIKGIGMKESAHFLRNIGFESFPIIDVHVQNFLRKMKLYGSDSKSLTKKQYFELEKKFLELAGKLKISPVEIDIAIWLYQSGERDFYG